MVNVRNRGMSVGLQTPTVAPRVRQAGQVGNSTSSALLRASDAAQTAANSFSDFYNKEAQIQNDLLLATAQSDWTKTYQERSKTAGPGFAKGLLSDYDAYVAKVMDGAPARGKDQLKLAFEKYRLKLGDQALRREAAGRAAAKAKAVAETHRLKANALISDPSLLGDYMQGATQKEKSLYVRSALSGLNESNPSQVNDQVKSGKWDKVLTPDQKLSFLKSSQAKIEADKRVAQREDAANKNEFVKTVMQEEINYAAANGALPADSQLTNDQIDRVANGDTAWAKTVKHRRDVAVEMAQITNKVATAQPSQINDMIDEAKAQVKVPGKTKEDINRLQAISKALSQRATAITKDAAGFVTKHDIGAELYLKAVNDAPPEMKQDAIKKYTSYMSNSYELMGVPPGLQTFMPKQMAQDTVTTLKNIGTAEAPQALGAIVSEWGDKAPAIIQQLRKEGLPAEYAVAMRYTDNPGLSAEIASLAGAKDLGQNIDPTIKKDINTEIVQATADYASAFLSGGDAGAVNIWSEQTATMRALAYKRALASNMDGSSIVDSVVQQMLPEHVINQSNMHLIISEDINPGMVRNALGSAMNDLNDISVPKVKGQTEASVRAQEIASIKDYGVWVNNGKSDAGAVLMRDVNGYLTPVKRANGKNVEVIFSELHHTSSTRSFFSLDWSNKKKWRPFQ